MHVYNGWFKSIGETEFHKLRKLAIKYRSCGGTNYAMSLLKESGGRSAWYNVTKSNVLSNLEMSHDTEMNVQNLQFHWL